MQFYCESLTKYLRLKTREVKVGNLLLGNHHPIRLQTMTTKNTMDTQATVEEVIRCIHAGAELVRITAPSKKEAENLLNIKNELHQLGYHTPLVADIHFTPNAAEIAARIVEKVRINPGNYVDKKKFEQIDYTNAEYTEELDKIRRRFIPLINICKEYGTAMRIGTNHGSLSDRIMSRYGDTPMGMVESAMEFLRIARDENYHQIVLSMKASNTQVMVQAYRLLIRQMDEEFGEIYPLHLGITEAGDGEDGRIKSAVGIGALLEDGIGDTIRVSLTEDPEFEIPVCRDLVKRYEQTEKQKMEDRNLGQSTLNSEISTSNLKLPYSSFQYCRRKTFEIKNIGGQQVPVVISDLSKLSNIQPNDLECVGYRYDAALDKWSKSDMAADYIFTGQKKLDFPIIEPLKIMVEASVYGSLSNNENYFPLFTLNDFLQKKYRRSSLNFVHIDCCSEKINDEFLEEIKNDKSVALCLSADNNTLQNIRSMMIALMNRYIENPVIIRICSDWQTPDEHLIHFSAEAGGLLIDGFGDGIWLNFSENAGIHFIGSSKGQFLNAAAFGILQAARTRISKTEYISCPGCGRTLFNLQETTEKIRSVTHHLKNVKIAVMGCIVNGPGEMADADFGYVGSGVDKITLYKGKDVVKRNIPSEIAVAELINLLKENKAWVEK